MRRREPESFRPDWVLIANAGRARCFARDRENGALHELSSFVHPASRLEGHELATDRAGHAFKGGASTQYEPRTDRHEKEHARFAHLLAAHLEQAAQAQRFERLALCASSEFLGELRARLGPAASARLETGVPVDLTAYAGPELERRVAQALARAAEPGEGR